jgi:hypothetical protein
MPNPFPGMDPYIERPAIFPDFHDSMIYCLRSALQPLLKPRYVALAADRLFVVESDRPIRPDVAIVQTRSPQGARSGGTAVAEADAPAVFEFWREEIREPVIHIVEPAAENRVVTAIEVLSPDNKAEGPGRQSYIRKREEFWGSGTNLVEIDLLREGEATVRIATGKLEDLKPWHYLVCVTRRWPSRQEVYPIPLPRRLPRVGIPLAANEADVTLDLQTVMTRCWEEGPYPEILRYDGPPPGRLMTEELAWCVAQLTAAGFRIAASDSSAGRDTA